MARPRMLIPLLVGFVLMVAACSVFAQQAAPSNLSTGPAHPDLEAMASSNVVAWTQPLMPEFEKAAAKHNVPLPLLLTLGYLGSGFENRGDAPTIENGYGVMALRNKNAWHSDSLGEGIGLTKGNAEKIVKDPGSNINAAAAVLSAYANQMKIDRSKGLQEWLYPVIKYAGLDPEYSRMFAMEVFEQLLTGLKCVNAAGETFQFGPQDIGNIDLSDLEPASAVRSQGTSPLTARPNQLYSPLTAQYGPAVWYPAASCNYQTGSYSKNTVVIHTIEGSAAGCLSWFNNCSAQVSAHYVSSQAGGIWQCVDEWYRAWHVGCANNYCIGIENEGYASDASHPQAQYDAVGLLVRDICDSWGIPKSHNACPPGVLGHVDINNCVCGGTHWDPGGGWDWGYFMGVVTGAPPPPSYAATYLGQSYPSTMVAGSTATAWIEFRNDGTAVWGHAATRLGTQQPQDRSSVFYTPGNWINAGRPSDVDQSAVSQGQTGRFTFIMTAPSTPGTYTEHWMPLQEGVTWFGPDCWFQITVTPNTGTVSGNVKDSGATNLSGVTVSIAGVASTTTDANGNYSLANIPSGGYTVVASKSGYNDSSAPVTVTAGNTTTQNFTLTSSDTQAPSVPTNLAATAVSGTQINLTWTASTDNVGVTGYKIYRGGTQIGTSTTASYSDTTCASYTSYTYTVSAYDAAGNNSAQSTSAGATTWDTTAPSVPTNLGATVISPTQVNLAWTASTDNVGVTGYKIYRDGVQIGTSATVAYSDMTAAPGNTYSYQVSAYDARANESAKSTAAIAITSDTVAPSAPTNLGTTVISQTQINLTWTASTDNVGVTGYKVFRDSVQIGTSATAAYSDTTCQSYTTYTYTVSAYDAAGNNSTLSNSAQGTTTPFTDIVIDNPAATYVGTWFLGTSAPDKYGADYNYCTTAATETKTATFTPKIDIAGYYTVYVWYPQGANRSTMAPFTVVWNGGQQTVNVNQTTGGGQWITLVTNKKFAAGTAGYVKLGNGTGETSLSVMADAVRVLLISSDLDAPTVPTNVAAAGASATSVNVTWTASTDNTAVTGYRIFRNGAAVGTSATASFTDTGLAQLTTYAYTVTAYDAMGNESAQSSSANGTTWDGTAPSIPAGLTATAATPTRVNLAWSASTDNVAVTGYNIYRGGAYVTTVTTTTYVDTGRSPSTAYTYTVSAIDARSNESAQSTAAGATTPAFSEIIIDNPAATITGVWATLTTGAKYGADFIYASTAVTEGKTATFRPTVAYAGNYNVYVWYTTGSNRSTASPYFTQWDGGSETIGVNQTVNGGVWVLLQSSRHFATGTAGYVKLGNGTGATGKIVVADAVRFVQVSGD
jgi:chitodextrinase